jgi:hypothetical protein
LKVDEIHCSILLEARRKQGKSGIGALRVARAQSNTPAFKRVLLDYLGHQVLQFHAEEYGTLGWPSFEYEDGGPSLLCWADAVHPDVFGYGYRRTTRSSSFKNIDPREGKVMREFVGKGAFVTGGASGIGLALGRAFAEAGCKVMVADIEEAALDAAVASLSGSGREIRGIVCDVADPASVDAAAEATFSAFGKVHILCNAGVGALGGIDHIARQLALASGRESDWRRQWGASFRAAHASAW